MTRRLDNLDQRMAADRAPPRSGGNDVAIAPLRPREHPRGGSKVRWMNVPGPQRGPAVSPGDPAPHPNRNVVASPHAIATSPCDFVARRGKL